MQLIFQGQDRFPTSASMQGFSVQGPSTATRNDGMSIWYDPSQCNDATARVKLGSWWFDETSGNSYQYVKATAALLIGQLVTQAAPTVDTSTANATDFSTVTTTASYTVNAEVGNYMWLKGADAGGVATAASLYVQGLRLIKANTAQVFTLAAKNFNVASLPIDSDPLHAAPTGAKDLIVIRPYQVALGSATLCPVGVAIGPVTSGNFTMIQKSGLALVQAVGSGTTLTIGEGAVPGATGGILGGTPGKYNAGVSIVPLYTWAGAASLIPCMVNFIGA